MTSTIEMGPDAIAAIRELKTSQLIGLLNDREAIARSIGDRLHRPGQNVFVGPGDIAVFRDAIAAEIDRRIPIPDPRIGKMCRQISSDKTMRVVGVEPGGALRLRAVALLAKRSGRTIDDVTEIWHERAAIREYEGGKRRKEAEQIARDDVADVVLRDVSAPRGRRTG